jgi:hypothetical protein
MPIFVTKKNVSALHMNDKNVHTKSATRTQTPHGLTTENSGLNADSALREPSLSSGVAIGMEGK